MASARMQVKVKLFHYRHAGDKGERIIALTH
jgi:hypothetical protein